jgi:hypothetical protein
MSVKSKLDHKEKRKKKEKEKKRAVKGLNASHVTYVEGG